MGIRPPTRLYRVTNKSRRGMWIFATDEQDAINQAVTHRHGRSPSSIIKVEDQTDDRLVSDHRLGIMDTQQITSKGLRGPGVRGITPSSFQSITASLTAGGPIYPVGGSHWIQTNLS